MALTPSINKDHLSNFDSNNSPSISLFVDSVLEPFEIQEGYLSSILHVDLSVIPSFDLNHDPNQQPDTIQCVLTTIVTSIVPDFHPTSSICSSFSNIFKLQFIFFLKHLNMGKSLFYLGIPLLNESFILPHIMSNLTPTSMLFLKSTTLIISFIPFSSHNPDQQTGGATGLLFYRLRF